MASLVNLTKLDGKPGVFYLKHETRKTRRNHPDRKWIIRQRLGGVVRISTLGWESEGIKESDVINKAALYKSNFKWNKLNPDQPAKPICSDDEKRIAADMAADIPSFKDFAERFIQHYAKKKLAPSTAQEYERKLNKILVPAWGKRKVIDIKRSHIIKLVEKMSDETPVMANRTLSAIKKIFSYALNKGIVEVNPAVGIEKPGAEQPRTRYLEMAEIKTLFNILEGLPDRDSRDILQLIVLTAQRPGEIRKMHVNYLKRDDSGLWFELLAGQTKNSEPTRIFLNDKAENIIQARINDMSLTGYIFPAQTKTGFIRKDVLVRKVSRLQALTEKEGMAKFTAHDLRRSAATGIAKLGFGSVVDDILNHKQRGITRRVYDLYDRGPEIKAALTAWGEAIQRAIDGTNSNIIPIAQNQ